MAIRFQYNKTSLSNLGKQLKIRENALPILKNKESALRVRLQLLKAEKAGIYAKIEEERKRYEYLSALWNEFEPGLIKISGVDVETVKQIGVKVPVLKEIHYEINDFNAFTAPAWYPDGVRILKEFTEKKIEINLCEERYRIIEFNLKKTTQKVNLYEKVQIPGYKEAIRKIKGYLEDAENLSKAASKIVKARHEEEEEEENA